jgi:hypothetical protein
VGWTRPDCKPKQWTDWYTQPDLEKAVARRLIDESTDVPTEAFAAVLLRACRPTARILESLYSAPIVQWVDKRGEVPRRMLRSARLCFEEKIKSLTLHSVVTFQVSRLLLPQDSSFTPPPHHLLFHIDRQIPRFRGHQQNRGIQGFVQWVDKRGEVPRRMLRSARLCFEEKLHASPPPFTFPH